MPLHDERMQKSRRGSFCLFCFGHVLAMDGARPTDRAGNRVTRCSFVALTAEGERLGCMQRVRYFDFYCSIAWLKAQATLLLD